MDNKTVPAIPEQLGESILLDDLWNEAVFILFSAKKGPDSFKNQELLRQVFKDLSILQGRYTLINKAQYLTDHPEVPEDKLQAIQDEAYREIQNLIMDKADRAMALTETLVRIAEYGYKLASKNENSQWRKSFIEWYQVEARRYKGSSFLSGEIIADHIERYLLSPSPLNGFSFEQVKIAVNEYEKWATTKRLQVFNVGQSVDEILQQIKDFSFETWSQTEQGKQLLRTQ